MLALGYIQALKCNTNTSPVGVTTQDSSLTKGLDVESRAQLIANYHHKTIKSLAELVVAAGLDSLHDVKRFHINRRADMSQARRYDEIFPCHEETVEIDYEPLPS